MSLPEPVRPSSGLSTITAQGPAASAGAEPSFQAGADTPGPTNNHRRLLGLIPRGRRRATSMPELAAALGCSDREVRQLIEELVNDWHCEIVTLPVRRGVFVAETPEEIDLAEAHLRAKTMALLRRRRSLRLCRDRLAYSPTLF